MSTSEIPWCVITNESAYNLGYTRPPEEGERRVSYIFANEALARKAIEHYGKQHLECVAFPMTNGIVSKVIVETKTNVTYSVL